MNNPSACAAGDPWLSHPAHVTEVTPEAPGVATYHVTFDEDPMDQEFGFKPGQFNMLYLPGLGEIAISISGSPFNTGPVPHTIRTAGTVTQALADLGRDAAIGVRGPFGSRWPLEKCRDRDIVLVAGGIGLAPLRPVIHEIMHDRDSYGSVTVLCGARTAAGLLYRDEHAHWESHNVTIAVTVDRAGDGWDGHVGVVTLLLDRMPLTSLAETVLMTCGPEVMMWYTIQAALRRGFRQEHLWLSLERNMNCAIGLCGHCQFGPEFICKDGPIFRFDRVASILRTDDL
jgi:NAD(P)H-flavin reductase